MKTTIPTTVGSDHEATWNGAPRSDGPKIRERGAGAGRHAHGETHFIDHRAAHPNAISVAPHHGSGCQCLSRHGDLHLVDVKGPLHVLDLHPDVSRARIHDQDSIPLASAAQEPEIEQMWIVRGWGVHCDRNGRQLCSGFDDLRSHFQELPRSRQAAFLGNGLQVVDGGPTFSRIDAALCAGAPRSLSPRSPNSRARTARTTGPGVRPACYVGHWVLGAGRALIAKPRSDIRRGHDPERRILVGHALRAAVERGEQQDSGRARPRGFLGEPGQRSSPCGRERRCCRTPTSTARKTSALEHGRCETTLSAAPERGHPSAPMALDASRFALQGDVQPARSRPERDRARPPTRGAGAPRSRDACRLSGFVRRRGPPASPQRFALRRPHEGGRGRVRPSRLRAPVVLRRDDAVSAFALHGPRLGALAARPQGTKTLPIVLPVLLHQGDGVWKAPPELASMLDASPELLEAVRPFQPHFRFLLDDLSALSAAASPPGRSRRFRASCSSSCGRRVRSRAFQDAAPFMRAVARGALVRDERTRALLGQFYLYVWSTAPADVDEGAIRSILVEIAGPEGEEDVMNAAEQLDRQGRPPTRGAKRRGLRTAITTASRGAGGATQRSRTGSARRVLRRRDASRAGSHALLPQPRRQRSSRARACPEVGPSFRNGDRARGRALDRERGTARRGRGACAPGSYVFWKRAR